MSVCLSVRLGDKLSRAVSLHLSRSEINQSNKRALREHLEHQNQSHTVGALNTASCYVCFYFVYKCNVHFIDKQYFQCLTRKYKDDH